MLWKFRMKRAVLLSGVLIVVTLSQDVRGQKRIYARVDPNAGAVNRSAEIYDALAGAFEKAQGDLAIAREGHTVTLLPDGKVLITGGFNGGYLSSAEIFDPATGGFTPTSGAMTAPRKFHRAILMENGRVLVAGGYGNFFNNSAELFDPAAGTFTATVGQMIVQFRGQATKDRNYICPNL